MQPRVKPGPGNIQYPTHRHDTPYSAVLIGKAVLQSDSLTKYRAALFRISRSSSVRFSCALSFRISLLASSKSRYASPLSLSFMACLPPRFTALHRILHPRPAQWRDHGRPQVMSLPDLEYYCELIAALRLRTTNKAGRHLSTGRAWLGILIDLQHAYLTAKSYEQIPSIAHHETSCGLKIPFMYAF